MPTRIAYVCADPGVPVFGRKGCSIHVQEVLRALRRCGADVELFATRFDGEAPPDLAAVVVHKLPAAPKGELAAREQACLAINPELRRALEREGPFDLVYERYSLWSFAGMWYARDARTPGLLEVNAPLIEEQAEHRGLVDRAGAEWVAREAFGGAHALIAVSEEVAGYLGQYPAARGRVHVVANAVDPGRFPLNLEPSRPRGPGGFTVGFVGTLKPWHGLPALADAFARLHRRAPQAQLLIIGEGPEHSALEARLSAAGPQLLEAVHFAGAVGADEVPRLLASMDVAVAPYPKLPHFYFSPLKVYEYMAAGLPVVASRIGQLTRIIQHGVNGLLCPPGDPSALAAALDSLWRAPELRARLGAAARATVLREHTWDEVARRILRLAGLEPSDACDAAEVRS